MFIYLVGKVEEIHKNSIYLETNSGMGFEIFVSSPELFDVSSNIKLYIYTYFKEETFALYGFKDDEHLKIFTLLNEVNGVGPKTALQIIKNIDIDRLLYYVSYNKINELSKVNGVGNKAERIIIELKPKLKYFNVKELPYENAFNALLSLGYSGEKINRILSSYEKNLDEGEVIKRAIMELKNE